MSRCTGKYMYRTFLTAVVLCLAAVWPENVQVFVPLSVPVYADASDSGNNSYLPAGGDTPGDDEAAIPEGLPEEEMYFPEISGDSTELFASYVEQQFFTDSTDAEPDTGIGRLLKKAAFRLGGINVLICQLLKERVCAVAAGEESNTQFFLSIEELGLTDMTWTAEELGVEAIVVDGKITSEAMRAASGLIGIRLKNVVDSLLASCPYELYWYDKTIGVRMTGPRYSANRTDGVWRLRPVNGYTFSFTVSADYTAGEYTVDTSTGEAVAAAAANARGVVDANAGLPDLEKLQAYRTEICGLTAYNYTVSNDPSYSYGDPWQLIWVFDNDPNTKVVCEGYAKAFQYLFDMSTFYSETIDCRIVTGIMNSGSGGRNHMWNILTLPDGLNYLADVTNCDAGTAGYPDRVFLVRPDGEDTLEENSGGAGEPDDPESPDGSGSSGGTTGTGSPVGSGGTYLAGYTFTLPSQRKMNYMYGASSLAIYEPADLILTKWEVTGYILPDAESVFADAESVLPGGVETVEEEAFFGSGVRSVLCPESLVSIEDLAFAGCTELQHIYIPAATENISENAFDGCGQLVIWGQAGSEAEAYAASHNILFREYVREETEPSPSVE